MRNLWLLADRTQRGSIQVLEEDKPINEIQNAINLEKLPLEFVIGIPEEVLRKKSGNFFLFGQYIRLKNEDIFCLSAPAGRDISNRIVVISNIQILDKKEKPTLEPQPPSNVKGEDKEHIEKILGCTDSEKEAVSKMLKAVDEHIGRHSFSSEKLYSSKYKHQWMPRQWIPKKKPIKYYKLLLIIIFIIFIIFIFL